MAGDGNLRTRDGTSGPRVERGDEPLDFALALMTRALEHFLVIDDSEVRCQQAHGRQR